MVVSLKQMKNVNTAEKLLDRKDHHRNPKYKKKQLDKEKVVTSQPFHSSLLSLSYSVFLDNNYNNDDDERGIVWYAFGSNIKKSNP